MHFGQAEVEKREQRLDALQERVTELKERAKLQETPLQMQVNMGGEGIWYGFAEIITTKEYFSIVLYARDFKYYYKTQNVKIKPQRPTYMYLKGCSYVLFVFL